jgi:hypothetical protein
MTMTILATAATLSDGALLARVQVLADRERRATVELVAHLAELDTRQILVAEGYSLFTYCTRRLGFSEDAACTRIEVARTARRFPVILDRLAEGSLSLTAVRLLAPHLTAHNHEEVLAAASRRTRREIEVLVARLAPRPDVPASVRKLPVAPAHLPLKVGAHASRPPLPPVVRQEATGEELPAAAVLQAPPRRTVVAPLAPQRYQVQFTVGQETHDTLRRLQDLLRREIPNGDPAAIVHRALTLLLRKVETRKLAVTSQAKRAGSIRSGPDTNVGGAPDSRHVPAAIRRAVWKRDDGGCAFVSKSGHRCAERTFLELHHLHPYALGGPSTVDNLALRCRRHNAYESELTFGPFVGSSGRETTEAYSSIGRAGSP